MIMGVTFLEEYLRQAAKKCNISIDDYSQYYYPRERYIDEIHARIAIAKGRGMLDVIAEANRSFPTGKYEVDSLQAKFDERLRVLLNDDIDGHIDFFELWRVAGFSTEYRFDWYHQELWYRAGHKLGFIKKPASFYEGSMTYYNNHRTRRVRVSCRGLEVRFDIKTQSVIIQGDYRDCVNELGWNDFDHPTAPGRWRIPVKNIPGWREKDMVG